MFTVNTGNLLSSDDEDEAAAPAAASNASLVQSQMAAELQPKVTAAMRVVTRLRPDNPIEVFAGALLGKPEPSPGSGNREGSVAAFLTANVTGLVTEAMTAALTAEPPPADPVTFVAEYLMSKK
jgi:hypothetical protein